MAGIPRPPDDAPRAELLAWVAQFGGDVESWPPPSPERIAKLRRLFGIDGTPATIATSRPRAARTCHGRATPRGPRRS